MTVRNLGSVLVLGAGKTGISTARYLCLSAGERVESVHLYTGTGTLDAQVKDELERLGCVIVEGTQEVEGWFNLCIASPGISEFSGFYLSAKEHCNLIMSEPEFAYRESPSQWVAITGTNGKTTATTLTARILNEAGHTARAVGNIGNLCIDEVENRPQDSWMVAELSSFQLAGTSEFHPQVACLLNITSDHIAWHKNHENYCEAKKKIFQNLNASDLCVLVQEGVCKDISDELVKRGLRVAFVDAHKDCDTPCAAFVREGQLVVRLDGCEYLLCGEHELNITGKHNIEDALCAAVIVLECGCDADSVSDSLKAFQPLPHRIEPCGTLNGVTFVNDSKATNTDAAIKALDAFAPGSIVLLCGGHDKQGPLEDFAQEVVRTCHVCVCFGEAQKRFYEAIKSAAHKIDDPMVIKRADNLKAALLEGYKLAQQNDTVLLSPACSSFDEFSGFEQRGDMFKAYVREIIDTHEGN